MKRRLVAGAALLVLAACGGGDDSSFDEQGLRDYIEENARASTSTDEIDALVETVEGDCEDDRTDTQWAVFLSGLDEQYVEMLAIACPDVIP